MRIVDHHGTLFMVVPLERRVAFLLLFGQNYKTFLICEIVLFLKGNFAKGVRVTVMAPISYEHNQQKPLSFDSSLFSTNIIFIRLQCSAF